VYDYGVLLCYKVIFLHRKGSFYVGCVFSLFPLLSRGSRALRGCQGDDGGKGLCSWSFDAAHFGRGQLIIQLTPCGFCTYSSVLYSSYIPSRLAAFTLSGSCILNPWFLGSFSFICSHLLFIYFLPFSRISVCLSAFGVSSVRDRHRVVGASVFPYSLCLVLFTLCCSFVTTHFMFFFTFFSFHRSFSEKREKRKKKEKGRCSGDWGSLRHGVWKVLLYNIMLLFLFPFCCLPYFHLLLLIILIGWNS